MVYTNNSHNDAAPGWRAVLLSRDRLPERRGTVMEWLNGLFISGSRFRATPADCCRRNSAGPRGDQRELGGVPL